MSKLNVYEDIEDYVSYSDDMPTKVYGKSEVDAAIEELKAENRKLKRALWIARAERAKEMCQRLLIQGFDPKWQEVERKCRAKMNEYVEGK